MDEQESVIKELNNIYNEMERSIAWQKELKNRLALVTLELKKQEKKSWLNLSNINPWKKK